MTYQWGPQGPAFEFPTCYRVENRFLTLRAAALIVTALVILWVALAEPDAVPGIAILASRVTRGSSTLHVLVALLLMVLGLIDLWAAARQRRVLLVPGQPASLTNDLVRQSKGVSAGAAWLSQVLASGMVPTPELSGPYRDVLRAVAPQVAEAPACLQAYLSVRLAHLLFGAGLLLGLGLTWLAVPQPATLGLATLFYSALAAALVARSAWITKAAPSPVAVGAALALAAIVGLLIGGFGAQLPYISKLANLGLPVATAAVLVCLLLIEGVGLLAGRVGIDPPPQGTLAAAEATVGLVAEPERLMQEIERELHSYWTEGIPNRRHAWQTSLADPKSDGARFSATVLEESQPVLPIDQHDAIAAPAGARRRWLLVLDSLGLLLTLVGCGLWVRLAHNQMQDAASPLTPAASALVLMVAGGYALRVGHLLWSRIEVESTLLWLRCTGDTDAAAVPPRERRTDTAELLSLQLRMAVVRARSVFYAAADHVVGNRTLTHLSGDEAVARRSVQQVRAYAERLPGGAAADVRPAAASFNPARPSVPAAEPARVQTRFCAACGTAATAGARFCQRCGEPMRQG